MRLIPNQGEAIQLGYRAEEKERILGITSPAGLNLAVGSRGIQGIQCILDGERLSKRLDVRMKLQERDVSPSLAQ